MIKSLWIAKTGLEANQSAMDVISNNLANVSTTGFKKSRAVFEDLLYQQARGAGSNTSANSLAPTGLQVGTGTREVATVRNHTQGSLNATSNPLDLAIEGNGFFQVAMPDGTVGYTREGSFTPNADGQLVNPSGYLLQPVVQIPNGSTEISIGKDGIVTGKLPGATAKSQMGQIEVTNFMNPAGLQALGGNIYSETAASGAAQNGTPGQAGFGSLAQGFLESSNVNVVEELVNMIQSQRAYEINSKALQASDQMLQKISQI